MMGGLRSLFTLLPGSSSVACTIFVLFLALAFHHAAVWSRDVVVVVTWFSAPLDWLRVLPASRTRVVLYAKSGGNASCATVPTALARLVESCVDTQNFGGREAHSMASFMESHHHDLPRVTIFVQDDCPGLERGRRHSRVQVLTRAAECKVLRLATWDRPAHDAWLVRMDASPGAWAEADNCLCTVVDEVFRECDANTPPTNTPCHGDGFYAMQYLASALFDVPLAQLGRVRWTDRCFIFFLKSSFNRV